MIDNRKKFVNIKEEEKNLKSRNLVNYSDNSQNSFLGFEKIIYHPEKIVGVKQRNNAFPISATISLGNYCNHACLWCSTAYWQKEGSKSIDFNDLKNWLHKAKKNGLKSASYVGNGEPLAYKKFKEISTFCNDLKLDQGIFTNGYLIDRYFETLISSFTYLRVSLDAGSSEIHSKLHKAPETHYPKILKNIKQLIKLRKTPHPTVGIQFATHQHNINDLEKSIKTTKDLGVDYFSIKPVFNRGSVSEKIEPNSLTKEDFDKVYERVRHLESDKFKIFYRPHQIISEQSNQNMLVYDKCFAGYFGVNIYENGTITGCGPHHIPVGTLDMPLDELEKNIIKLSEKLDLKKCPSGCRFHNLNFQLHKIINSQDFSKEEHLNLF